VVNVLKSLPYTCNAGKTRFCGGTLALETDELLKEVGLFEKASAPAASLSGGMKRKLCLAMALIGDPKLVILDEPTSGIRIGDHCLIAEVELPVCCSRRHGPLQPSCDLECS
jgi:ABC-type Mn2+/Zn2+ transport system ATPase subunit